MSQDSPEKHPDGFVSIRVVPREIGKVIYADRWQDLAKRLRKRDDLRREHAAALKDRADPVTIAAISSRLSAAEAAVLPEWGRLLIEADRLITSGALPLYHYQRSGLPYPVPKDRFAGDAEEYIQARRRMVLSGRFPRVFNLEQRRGRQIDLRSLIRNSDGSVTLVTDKDEVNPLDTRKVPDLVVVLERDLREALQRLRESLEEQQTAGPPQPAAPAEGPQSDAETPETQREKRTRETKEKYKRWNDLAQKIKGEGRWTRPTEIASAIAKREKGSTKRGVNALNIRRRLDKAYPGWAK